MNKSPAEIKKAMIARIAESAKMSKVCSPALSESISNCARNLDAHKVAHDESGHVYFLVREAYKVDNVIENLMNVLGAGEEIDSVVELDYELPFAVKVKVDALAKMKLVYNDYRNPKGFRAALDKLA